MREVRKTPRIKKVLVASGIRMDLARRSPEYMTGLAYVAALATYQVGTWLS